MLLPRATGLTRSINLQYGTPSALRREAIAAVLEVLQVPTYNVRARGYDLNLTGADAWQRHKWTCWRVIIDRKCVREDETETTVEGTRVPGDEEADGTTREEASVEGWGIPRSRML